MQKSCVKNIFVYGIILLFVGISIIPSLFSDKASVGSCSCITVDSTGQFERFTSIAFNSYHQPPIHYNDITNGALKDIKFINYVNQPPNFGVPTPVNRSTNNLLSFIWSIQINDSEGDSFSWTIQCSNGQVNSGTGATNGTKSLMISGLAYSTIYTIWVNATDPTGSGLYTRKWYTFTTKLNFPPTFGLPNPGNGSTNNPLNISWIIAINDRNGDQFSWTIQCDNGQTISGTSASNGTKSLMISGLAYSTIYKVWVNATDPSGSGLWTRRWYTFTTKLGNNPLVFGAPSPANSSIENSLSFSWGIPINDSEGDLFSWTIQCSSGLINNGTGATNGTKSLSLSGLAYSTTYKVWVNATDSNGSGTYTRKWYIFTTQQQQNVPPNKPSKPSGPANGKVGQEYPYTTSTTDPDEDQVYYLWDWGDGNMSDWLGPYGSGVTAGVTHNWTVKGSYSIKVKAKDTFGAESPWSDPLPITMPYTIKPPFQQFLDWLFERFPHAFPILRHLLGY